VTGRDEESEEHFMEPVFRAFAIYVLLMIVFRIAGKRTLAQITTFDFILLLIVSEATQNALIGNNYSLTNAALIVITLIGTEIGLSVLKQKWPRLDKWIEGLPLVIVDHGQPIKEHMHKARIDESDILTAARELQGLERMDQIKYAVLERNGVISVIPR
jgi:uncharacterized membrane protein YcaP (DUF421 family)